MHNGDTDKVLLPSPSRVKRKAKRLSSPFAAARTCEALNIFGKFSCLESNFKKFKYDNNDPQLTGMTNKDPLTVDETTGYCIAVK